MILDGVHRVLFVHAHPDDETLATGALIAYLRSLGIYVAVLTATRGEEGEIVDGPLRSLTGTPEFVTTRERELAGALAALDVNDHAFLGQPPARLGASSRIYRDSGMQWVTPTLAGPADTADERSFTAADPAEIIADITAYVAHVSPDLLISYDDGGGYGHPDHVRAHEVVTQVAAQQGIPFAEVASPDVPNAEIYELSGFLPIVTRALECHQTQVTVDGADVIHSGGQREPILTTARLHRVAARD